MEHSSILGRILLGDGRAEQLPATRRAAFSFYGKLHFWKLLLCGVMASAFFLPLLIWLYAANWAQAQALAALRPDQQGYLEAYGRILLQYAFQRNLIAIPLVCLLFVGLAGLFGICKRMIFCQSCGYGEFFRGIRSNGLQSGLCGLLFGASLFFFGYNVTYYQLSSLPPVVRGVLTGLSGLQFVVVAIWACYLLCGLAVYTNTAGRHLRNGLKLTFGLFWRNLLTVGGICLPLLLTVLTPAPWQLILLALLPMFYVGFGALALSCYCNGVFDRYVNPALGEEFVGIGLRKE